MLACLPAPFPLRPPPHLVLVSLTCAGPRPSPHVGLAIVLGACITFLINRESKMVMSATLAFAAGVIVYIAIVDLYLGDGVGHFADYGFSDPLAFTYASICFFGGFPVCWALSKMSHALLRYNWERRRKARAAEAAAAAGEKDMDVDVEGGGGTPGDRAGQGKLHVEMAEMALGDESTAPGSQLTYRTSAARGSRVGTSEAGVGGSEPGGQTQSGEMVGKQQQAVTPKQQQMQLMGDLSSLGELDEEEEEALMMSEMGLLVGIAIVVCGPRVVLNCCGTVFVCTNLRPSPGPRRLASPGPAPCGPIIRVF